MSSALTAGTSSTAWIAQNATRSLIVMSGTPGEVLITRRRANRPVASADPLRVYWAVVANDSPILRAMRSRMPEKRTGGGTRSSARIMPPRPEPAPLIS